MYVFLLAVEVENAVRLVGGSTLLQGTLQVYHAGTWGSVCDDTFDQSAAQVALQPAWI